ncbi:MAG: recombinase family protein [Lachnospiraceae bacterium]|nr:recombinase family protein [Lachnospiraceae bacterium]
MRWVSYTRAVSSRKGEENPPDIISRQNAHIETYMKEHGFKVSRKYSDRKYSADETESFNQMVQEGMKREFDGVVVESVFRCGRDLWTAIEILYETFYPAGIHFAVVEDDFCSVGKEKQKVTEYFTEKRSEWYADDCALRHKKVSDSGKISPTLIRYGFVLSKDHSSLEIEEEGASIVRQIYQMFLDGKNYSAIAKELNERGVTPPQEQKAIVAGKVPNVIVPAKWIGSSIRKILESPIYMGQATRKVKGVMVDYPVPQIVSEETFTAVQERIGALKRVPQEQQGKTTQTGLLHKRIYSKETGIALTRILSPLGTGEMVYVFSKSKPERRKNYISCETVHLVVRNAISTAVKQARYINRLLQEEEREEMVEAELKPLREKAQFLFNRMNDLYLERMDFYRTHNTQEDDTAAITEVEQGYQKQFLECEAQFKAVMNEVEIVRRTFSTANPWVALYREIEIPENLEHEHIVKWIGIVLVDKEKNIEVILKESEWMDRLPEEWLKEGAEE